jgi:hypothetical protein
MLILKRTNGSGVVFDTNNPNYSNPSPLKPDTSKSLHLNHHMTDYTFLSQFYPKNHQIFDQFGSSFYYVV